jgi:hypothetical protein
MKYTYECTEKEFVSVVKFLERVVDAVVSVQAIKKANSVVLNTEDGTLYEADEAEPEKKEKNATVHPFRVVETEPVRKKEQQVKDAIVNEPEPLPAEFVKKQKRLKKGEKAFSEFIHEWLAGIDLDTMELIPDATQPDRDLLLRATANSPGAYPILVFVAECGGLQRAIAKVTNNEDLAVRLARFIVPPASIAFPDLADQYEYTNPFQKDEDE